MKILPRFLLSFSLWFALVIAPDALARGHASGGHSSAGATVPVSGYYRSNGTHVAPYVRRAPGTAADAPASHTLSQSGPSAVIDSTPSQEQRNKIAAVVKEEPLPHGFSTAADRAKAIAKERPLYGWYQNEIPRPSARGHYFIASGVMRNANGRIHRNEAAKRAFMRMTGYPIGRPGYVVDHIIPLKRGGPDDPSNMQWQTIAEAKAKDRWE